MPTAPPPTLIRSMWCAMIMLLRCFGSTAMNGSDSLLR
jgi:hypothetical protein